MKMDLGTAVVGLISIVICISPFIVMYYNKKKKEYQMMKSLKDSATLNNCKISQHEFCGDFIIGIDENKNIIFFLKQKVNETTIQIVDITCMEYCKTIRRTRKLIGDDDHSVFTEAIELSFTTRHNYKEEIRLELFNEETNKQLSGELQLAENWSKRLNERLKGLK